MVPHIFDPARASTKGDIASLTFVEPPPQANDVRVADYLNGQAHISFVRFSAAPDVCASYAARIIHTKLAPLTREQMGYDLQTLRFGSSALPDLKWFDLSYAKEYWVIQNGKEVFQPAEFFNNLVIPNNFQGADAEIEGWTFAVRVDTSHALFYFYRVR
jgi:hypothetical protein